MRIKWKKIIATLALPAVIVAGVYAYDPPAELIEYHVEADRGDTIWSICSKIATDKEDMGKLVWQVTKDNHIEDPANLQPGQLIVIHVKPVKGGE